MRARLRIQRGVLLGLVAALLAAPLLALNPQTRTADFIRNDFTAEDGLPSNVVNAILQTRNGFLWIGTDAGLVRFNGRRFIPIELHSRQHGSRGNVRALAEGPDGDLWVGTGAGLVRIRCPALDVFDASLITRYHIGSGPADEVSALRFGSDGSLLIGTEGGLYRLAGGHLAAVVSAVIVNRIESAADGHLLIATQKRFLEWNGTRIVESGNVPLRLGVAPGHIFDVIEDRDGSRWFCTLAGLARVKGGELQKFPGYVPTRNIRKQEHNGERAEYAYQDGQGVLWVQFARMLFRVSGNRLEPLVRSSVRAMYSDRDGDLWVGTNGDGLLRFKDRAVHMFTRQDGLPSNVPMAVLSRHDGSLWVGTNCGGVSVLENHRFRVYDERNGLTNSCVWSLAEDHQNDLWLGTWGGGLFRFRNHRFDHFSASDGLAGGIVRAIQVAQDNSLWIATDHGVSHLVNGVFRNYTVNDGLASARVLAIYQDRLGRIWAGTNRGINRLDGNRFTLVPAASEVSDPRCLNFAESSAGELYLMGASNGLQRLQGDRFVALNAEADLFNLVQVGSNLWFSSGHGIFRFAAGDLKLLGQHPDSPVDYMSFGIADGLNSTQSSLGTPNMAVTADRKLWVATVRGLVQFDPNQLTPAAGRSVLFISDVTVGRVRQSAGRELILPPGTHHTELRFDAISLKSPEKVRFQYRMEGIDPVWLDANGSLTAVYTNIPKGTHVFHVRACNIDGVWDSSGTTYLVTQTPQMYETWWFRCIAVIAAGFLLAGAFRWRLKQLAYEFNMRLEERVNERTRIARDLHDTLLQSFQGLILRFQAVQNILDEKPEKAKRTLASAIEQAAQAVSEGRKAIQNLRSEETGKSLVDALSLLGKELAIFREGQSAPSYRVLMEGSPRQLRPGLEDHLYRIFREAVANAFKHSQAEHIELDIRYDPKELRLRVRDDGKGIDPEVLAKGERAGHWGLRGMRERAGAVNGRLEIWSSDNKGTEIEVAVPGSSAYERKRESSAR